MPRHLLRAVFLLALFAGTLGVAAPAALAVDTPFSVRFAQTMRGSINAVGNQLLTCPAAAGGCTDARNRVGTETTLNNNYNMGYVDVDGDASTFNSSTSTLSLPAGATVVWAGLYWGADTQIGSGGASAAPNAGNRGSVRFKVGPGSYQTVTAAPADVLTSTGKATRYRGFANVTALVPASGNATYTVANVQTGRGDDRFAGWSLVVAYQDATQDVHRVSVYDGLGTVDQTHTFATDITPFFTPETGTVATKTGLLAFEGDTGIVGETATFNGHDLTDAINGPGNLMNSTMAVDGVLFGVKNPNYGNLMGTDIDVWNSTGLLDNHQGTANLSFASNQDLFVPSALWLVSDEGPAANTAGPTLGGLARDGSTLTANPGTWEGTPTITYEYQWQRCDAAGANCIDIPGETGTSYTLTPDDVGSTVRVLVTAVNDAGSSTPAPSPATSTVTKLPPSNLTLPMLSGDDQDGQTLTTTIGGWDGTAPLDYDVQWLRCADDGTACADIPGATAWSYVLTGADIDSTVRSEVTASNTAGSAIALSAPTSTVDPAPPVNTTVPTVGGDLRDGQTLTAGDGIWTGTPTISYEQQWQRCADDGTACVDITGATGSTYVLTADDIGHAVRVEVTATNLAGNDVANSLPTDAVVAAPPTNTLVPNLSGTPRESHTLTLDDGTWTGTETIDYDYVWQRCDVDGANCLAIAGETGTSYTLTADDIDATIRALVTASNVAGVTTVATAPSDVIAADPPMNTTPPSTTGAAVDGGTLTAGDGTWTGTDPVVYTYQWQRCDEDGTDCADIDGATDPTYTLTGDDVDHTLRVVVTATNDVGSAPAASPATDLVTADPPVSVLPTISGSVTDGAVLTAVTGDWTGTEPIVFTYQWERCDADGDACRPIVGADEATYTLEDADAGQTVRVVVTGTNAAGVDVATSAPTTTIDGNPPANVVDPSLSGTARDGETLTLDDGDWTGTETLTAAYRWERCDAAGADCAPIAGATGPSYTLQADDVDGTVRAVVTYTNDYGTVSEATAPSEVVLATPPVLTVDPSVLGPAVDGETVTADPGVWAGTAPVTYTYQWLRCELDGTDCEEIADATDVDYTVTGEDAGHGIRVEVTATNPAGSDDGISPVAAVSAAAPQNTTLPSVTGDRVDGETLTADPGTWSGTAPVTFEYQWLRCEADGTDCVAIPGETGSEYTLTGDDVGHDVRVTVEASNAAATDVPATSAPSGGGVALAPPVSVNPPVISGLAEEGATLAATTGGWTGTEAIVMTYQWLRCDADGASCTEIDGATNSTHTLTPEDIGGSMRVEVTGTNAAGHDVGTSSHSDEIEAAPPVSTTPPGVTGSLVDGETLTAVPGAFSGTGPLDLDYQWQRCEADGSACVDIPDANDATYDLVSADVGGAIVVVVTATNAGGSDSAPSSATGEVLPLAPANVSAPEITGDPLDGHTLTVDPGAWTGTTPLDFTYQWQRCDHDGDDCVDIGADDPAYTLVPGDIDHVLSVVVTATNGGGSIASDAVQTAPAQAAPPVNTDIPTVTGALEDGETLTATDGTWTGTPLIIYAHQWQRCDADGSCLDIDGETGSTYTLQPADVGHAIVVEVTAGNDGGAGVATSVPSSSVAVDPPATTGTPTATGTALDGETLVAEPGTWTGTGPIDFTYRWQRCDADGIVCADIAGATDATYTLGSDDVGSTVIVLVTGDNGEETTVASPAVGPVAALPPTSTSSPTVSGSVGFGDTLTAGDGEWDGSLPLDFTYQWQRCDALGAGCVDIDDETDSTYTLTAADVGHAIRVEVTATNVADDASAVSAPTDAALPAPPVNATQPPAPTGTVVDGGTLTAEPGTWTGDGPIDFEYQWQRCDEDGNCVDIAGADEETYSPVTADAGHAIVVVVTATNPGGSSFETSAPTIPVAAAPPVNTTPPGITGTPEDGGTLTATPGTWTGTTPIDYTYQWQRCDENGDNCVDIPGATGDTYTPDADDIGHTVTVVVTADNDGGVVTETAAASSEIVAAPPRETTPPAVTGGVAPGDTLTADEGTWTGTDPVVYTYQWQRCDEDGTDCVDVAGATDPTYTLTDDDQGHAVVVVVTATNDAGHDSSASAPTVVPAPPVNTVPPSITGDEQVGETLTADPGTWTGTGPIDYEYHWQRCDFTGDNCVDIAGATDEDYTLTEDDLGHTITVVVTASNDAGADNEDAPTTPAVDVAKPTTTPTPTPTPTATPTATPAPESPVTSSPVGPAGPVSSASVFAPGAVGEDLGNVPGSLVGDTSCQQLAGNSKYRRAKLKGIGTVRVRAYSTGPATQLAPVQLTTQISGGKAKKVVYKLDGRKLKAKRGRTWKSAITPSKLRKIGIHTLKTTVTGRKKRSKGKVVVLKLKTTPCRTLFTAQRWRTTAGAGLRLRIDARTAIKGVAFTVAKPLLPRTLRKQRTIGFMRVFVAGEGKRRRYSLKLPKKGAKKTMLSGAGKPTVRLGKGGLQVSGLPARAAVTELTLYRVKKLDGATKRRVYKLRARVAPAGRTLSVRPRAPR